MNPSPHLSLVIPVYNSAAVLGSTIDACVEFLATLEHSSELILVNDGSSDGSWEVIRERCRLDPRLVGIDLLRNYGQHTAVLCGLEHSSGEYVVTLDDDMQNPPSEVAHLYRKAAEGHDVVFGRYRRKRHPWWRRLGSRVVGWLNGRVFHKPTALAVSNFRLLHRTVVARIVAHRTPFPYITGLAVMYARRPADVLVEHHPRGSARSTYGPPQIARLITGILFNYSAFPLRLTSGLGIVAAVASLLLAGYFLVRSLVVGTTVPGWASVAVMLAFFNGLSLLLLGMLGEYVVRILQQLSLSGPSHVAEIVRRRS
jgi:glycosyltransferase involved in cell wall biosynthesis